MFIRILKLDSGGRKYLGFAKSKIREIKDGANRRRDLLPLVTLPDGCDFAHKVYKFSDATVYIHIQGDIASIRIVSVSQPKAIYRMGGFGVNGVTQSSIQRLPIPPATIAPPVDAAEVKRVVTALVSAGFVGLTGRFLRTYNSDYNVLILGDDFRAAPVNPLVDPLHDLIGSRLLTSVQNSPNYRDLSFTIINGSVRSSYIFKKGNIDGTVSVTGTFFPPVFPNSDSSGAPHSSFTNFGMAMIDSGTMLFSSLGHQIGSRYFGGGTANFVNNPPFSGALPTGQLMWRSFGTGYTYTSDGIIHAGSDITWQPVDFQGAANPNFTGNFGDVIAQYPTFPATANDLLPVPPPLAGFYDITTKKYALYNMQSNVALIDQIGLTATQKSFLAVGQVVIAV